MHDVARYRYLGAMILVWVAFILYTAIVFVPEQIVSSVIVFPSRQLLTTIVEMGMLCLIAYVFLYWGVHLVLKPSLHSKDSLPPLRASDVPPGGNGHVQLSLEAMNKLWVTGNDD